MEKKHFKTSIARPKGKLVQRGPACQAAGVDVSPGGEKNVQRDVKIVGNAS
jgi:hypothetical protein